MPEGAQGFPGGGFHHGGSPFGGHGMSPEDANNFFAHFFGGSDPFGGHGGFGGPSHSNIRFSAGGGGDPFGSTFGGGGMPGGRFGGGMPGAAFGGMPGGMGGFPQQRRAPKRYDAIPNGTVVSLKGLVSKPERNGDRGEIVDYDVASGRYVVLLEDSDEHLRVKPTNLLQHAHGTVQNIQSQPDLNGCRGTIIAWLEGKERYSVYVMDRSKIVSVKPNNIVLENGTVGMIVNLRAKPELNGKYGTIQGWNRTSHRYDLKVAANQTISVKVENIRV